jgi:hypothetical protein
MSTAGSNSHKPLCRFMLSGARVAMSLEKGPIKELPSIHLIRGRRLDSLA